MTPTDVEVIDGYFTLELDFGPDIFTGYARWLETAVRPGDSNDPNAFVTLSPLLELTATPYALYAKTAGGDNDWMVSGNDMYSIPSGNVGIGTTSPLSKLSVGGDGLANTGVYGSGSTYGVIGQHVSTGNYGRLGTNLDGVYGQSSKTSGSGVAGINDGGGNGVYGRSNDGKAVHGVSSAGHAGYFNGDVTLSKPAGLGGGELVLRTATYNEPGRYRIRFANNYLGLFAGDDTQNQQFAFVSKWGKARQYDARLKVHGKASASWGTYIALTHDGNDGLIETDVGDIVLDPAGNVGIGTTSPAYKLTVSTSEPGGRAVYGEATDTGYVYNYGGYFVARGGEYAAGVYGEATGTYGVGVRAWGKAYDFYASNLGSTDYGSASSIRWKSNVRVIDDPLGKLLRLRGVYFNWDAEHGGEHDVGMIAEEVGEVLPEIVEYEEDGKYTSGMDYSKLTPLLVEAVKALKVEVNELQRQNEEKDGVIDTLKQQNDKLEGRLAALESSIATIAVQLKGGGK
jgi:hypothetical protein